MSAQGGPYDPSTGPVPGMPPEESMKAVAPARADVLSFDEFHRKCRDVFPIVFEGAKVMLNKQLSSHFQISHSINLSTNLNGYRFGSTYVGTKPAGGPGELFPVLLGDMDPQGNTSATILHQWANGVRLKGMAQVQQSKIAGTQLSLEHRGRLTTSAFTVANPNVLNNSGAFIASYVRRITEKLELGAELITQCGSQKPGQTDVLSILSYGLRYNTPCWAAAATASNSGFHASYYHRQSDTLQFGVDFESSFRQQETKASFAYQAEIADSFVFRASCDTDWTVSSVLEKKLSRHLPFTFVLSLIHNFAKPVTKVGAGLMVGG